jgi:hypothetical protein
MTLFEKIKTLYPDFTHEEYINSFVIQNDMDGRGEYLASWSHPTAPRPTEEQLEGVA